MESEYCEYRQRNIEEFPHGCETSKLFGSLRESCKIREIETRGLDELARERAYTPTSFKNIQYSFI